MFLLDMTPMSLLGSLRPCDGMCCFTHLITCNFHTSYHKKNQLLLSTAAAADGQTHDLSFELFWAFESDVFFFCESFSLFYKFLCHVLACMVAKFESQNKEVRGMFLRFVNFG